MKPLDIYRNNSSQKILKLKNCPGEKMSERENLQENEITREDFLSVSRRCRYNGFIADFYDEMSDENEMPVGMNASGEIVYGRDIGLANRAKALRECSKSWNFDLYDKASVKNLVRINRCRDRFCLNCQALAADQRFVQYSPILDDFSQDYDLYHIVFTVPNVDAVNLSDTVTLMLDRFSYLIRYFDGRKKIRNLDFKKYGYKAAVRTLEITVSKRNGSYHPHLHTIFILKKGLHFERVYWNRFSDDRTGRNPTRLFSEFELILQRIWCLLIMRGKVTKQNIEYIEEICPQYPDGFSCIADLSNGKYHEIFKYAIKGTYKEETLFTKEAFRTLYKALYDRKCYETYGELKLYDFNGFDESLGLNTPDEAFELYISRLQSEELPVRIEEQLHEILKLKFRTHERQFKYISRAVFTQHFKSLSEEDKQEELRKLKELLK